MGRWTTEYQDDVFLSKLKGLVSGAIKRSKLEKAEHTISFAQVVQDLDTADSFTSSVIDILVQELAERRLRSSPGDRRLIADRTAKSLRLLATPIRIYRERRNPGRRTVNMAEYLTAPPDELDMEEDDEEFETMLDRAAMPVEGVRVNSELFDAYYPPSWTGSASSASFRALTTGGPPTPALSDDSQAPPGLSLLPTPARTTSVWSLPRAAPGSLSLSRQPSLRRPARSRTVDFNEFSAQRRSSTRDLRTTESGAGDEPWTRTSRSTRRFFPFSHQPRRHDLHATGPDTPGEGSSSPGELSDEPLYTVEPDPTPSSVSASFYSFPTPVSSGPSSLHEGQTSAERVTSAVMPRLRRGGVRPPESLLLRRMSPALDIGVPQSPASDDFPTSTSTALPTAEITSYPTPGSPGNESGSENPA